MGFPMMWTSWPFLLEKWRTESIKAYGNAIVPQVMYRIFEAIEALKTIKRCEARSKHKHKYIFKPMVGWRWP